MISETNFVDGKEKQDESPADLEIECRLMRAKLERLQEMESAVLERVRVREARLASLTEEIGRVSREFERLAGDFIRAHDLTREPRRELETSKQEAMSRHLDAINAVEKKISDLEKLKPLLAQHQNWSLRLGELRQRERDSIGRLAQRRAETADAAESAARDQEEAELATLRQELKRLQQETSDRTFARLTSELKRLSTLVNN